MILDKKTTVKITKQNIEYFRNLNYNCELKDNIDIDIFNLQKGSHIKINVKCDICGEESSISYKNYNKNIKNYNIYTCLKCSNFKNKNTLMIKYGVEHQMQLDSTKEKIKNTSIERYGVDNPSKSLEIKEKTRQSCLNKYGYNNVLEIPKIKEKIKRTNNKKYNNDYYFGSLDFKEKIDDKYLNKHKNVIDILYRDEKRKYLFKCDCGKNHKYETTSTLWHSRARINSILCTICNPITNRLKNYDNIIEIKYNQKLPIYVLKCDCKKDHVFEISPNIWYSRKFSNTILCTICNPIYKSFSGTEIQLQNFIKENYNNEILTNQRMIIPPLELDIYIPDIKLAFEFNGLFWHNELNKDKNYHLSKTEECEKQGIQLIHIYEDDWLYKQDIVKSIILNKLGKTSNKIYARKCIIKEISDNNLIREFLEKNHIQGFVGSKIKIGLFYENELISLMTLGDRRVAMGKKSTTEGEYELLRFCNKLNTNVIGGASKLFKYFVDNYNPKKITTYADRSFSQGNLYSKLGFEFIEKTRPNYYYILNKHKLHRYNFRKDKLVKKGFDSNKTEHDIMLERKIFRIYDSGNLKFEYFK